MKLYHYLTFNPSRFYLKQFLEEAASSARPGDRVLDAGAGDSPYRDLFKHTSYDAADLGLAYDTGKLSYVCNLTSIPAQSGVYDLILCTQVLEHVREPLCVLQELHRLLKPHGKLWLSAPLFYAEHQIPHDYYRYTRYGLTYLLESAGFQVEKVKRLEGYFGTLAYHCQKGARALPLDMTTYGRGIEGYVLIPVMLLLKLGFAVLSVLFAHLDVHYKIEGAGYCKNYVSVAVKVPSQIGVQV